MSKKSSSGRLLLALAMAGVTAGCAGSSSMSPISVSLSSSASGIDQGQSLTVRAAVTNDSSGMGVSWSLTGPGSLSKPTALSVTYSAPASVTSPQPVIVTAASAAEPTMTASVKITVNPLPQITSQTLPSGSVGTPYSQTLAVVGGAAPFSWSVYKGEANLTIAGSVPDGLTLDPTTGTISGTPTAGGTWYFEASATDAAGVAVYDASLSIQINPKSQPANPVPFLNQPLTPTAVSPGASDFVLDVSGTGFVAGATVDFNRSALATTFVDSGHLSAVVPAADAATAGTFSVTVTNPVPGGGRSNAVNFGVGAPAPILATLNFVNAANSPLETLGTAFGGLVVSDFNEDGKPDLAFTLNNTVVVMLGNGDGTFQPASGSPLEVPRPPFDSVAPSYVGPLAAGDFNNSGHTGLAVGEIEDEAAAIFLGNGDGTFTLSSSTVASVPLMTLSEVETADFNRDGSLDLAIIDNRLGTWVVLGYGSGAFSPVGDLNAQVVPPQGGVVVGDFNGDGKLDVILSGGQTSISGSGIAVSLGNGDGTFSPGVAPPVPGGFSAIVAGDFNGDGNLDIAVTTGNAAMILLGDGTGGFGAPKRIPVGNQPEGITTGDFNNDGKLDLAIANFSDGTISLLLGNGNGTFRPASGSPYAVGEHPWTIRAADFNGDGKLDLATVNIPDGTVSVLLQQ